MPTTARQSLALPGSKILERLNLGRVVLLALRWPSPPLHRLRCALTRLANEGLVGLFDGHDALPFQGFHA